MLIILFIYYFVIRHLQLSVIIHLGVNKLLMNFSRLKKPHTKALRHSVTKKNRAQRSGYRNRFFSSYLPMIRSWFLRSFSEEE
jgi:hypothetical protein